MVKGIGLKGRGNHGQSKAQSPSLTPKQVASLRALLADHDEMMQAAVPNRPAPEVPAVRPHDAMRMIGCGASFFWKAVRAGEIPVVRYGRRLTMVAVSSLHPFLQRHAAPLCTRHDGPGAV